MYKKFFVLLCNILLFSNLEAQETVHYTHLLADYDRAYELYQQKAYAVSQQAFEEVSEKLDEFSELQADCAYYIATCALRRDDPKADQLITDFVKNYPNSLKRNDAYMDAAIYYYDHAQYAQALKWLGFVEVQGMSLKQKENYMFKYGYSLFATNHYEDSKKYFVQLLDSPVFGAQAKYYYGYVAYEQDDYENADKYLNQVSQNTEYQKDVSYYLADMNFKSGNFQKAIDAGLPLLKTATPAEKSEINKIVGESYFNLKEYEKAIPYLKEYKGKKGKWTNTDYYFLGYSYYKMGDFENAIAQFNKIIDGNNAVAQNAYYHLAECYLKTDKKPEALNAFRNASQMEFEPKICEDAYLNYAKLSYDIGNPYKNVAEVLQDFLNEYPDSPERNNIKNLIISAYLVSKDYQGAIKYLETEKLVKDNVIYQKAAYQYGIELFKEAQYAKAIEYFDKSLANPTSKEYKSRALFWKGESLFRLNEYAQALVNFNEFKSFPEKTGITESQTVDYHIGYVYFKQREYVKAVTALNQYVNQNPKDPDKKNDALLRLGDSYFMSSNYSKAVDSYLKSSELNTKTADYALFQSGISYGFLQNNNQKINLLNKVVNSYPNSLYKDDALYVLGTTYTATGQNSKAIEVYDKLINEFPKSTFTPRAMLKKGLIYYNTSQTENALKTFKTVVSKYPNTSIAQEAVQNARQIYIDTGKVDEYATWVKGLEFVEVSDNELESDMYVSAEKQFITADYTKAINSFKKYLETFPNGAHVLQAHFYLAQALENQKKLNEAIPHYEYVAGVTQNEFTEPSLVKLAQYNLDNNQWDKAIPYLSQLEQVAAHSQNVLYAQSNLMKAYYQKENFNLSVQYADKVLKNNSLDSKIKADAQLIIARSAFKTNDLTKARTAYKQVETSSDGVVKAEALFYDAYFKHLDGDYKNSNTIVQKIASDYAAHKYWGAKGLVVMAKNFYGLKDAYQATYILESVTKNFTQYPDVVEEAQTELKKIKAEQAKTNDSVIQD